MTSGLVPVSFSAVMDLRSGFAYVKLRINKELTNNDIRIR